MAIRNLLFGMIVVFAFAGNLFGTMSADIQQTCSIDLTQLSTIMSVSQIGTFISFLLLPSLVKRLGSYRVMIFGIIGAGLGFLGMGFSRSLYSFGIAFMINSLLGYYYWSCSYSVMVLCDPKRRTVNIPLTHLIYSLASVASGVYIAMIKGPRWFIGYYQMSGIFLLMTFLFLLSMPKARAIPALMKPPKRKVPFLDSFSLLRKRDFLPFFLFLIFYSSVEFCCSVYPLLFFQRQLGASSTQVALAFSLYYVGSSTSRIFIMPVLKKVNSPFLPLKVLCFLASLSLGFLAFSNTLYYAYLTMVLVGFSFGAINPSSQILEIMSWSEDIDQVANLHMISSVIGKLIVPLAVGAISQRYSLVWGLLLLSVVMAIALFFLFLAKWLQRSSC
ncbi:MFS transporter [uncultured Sphaerochaeta sp.]|uniref:MFS transporter n=1 Tax=uncultured Sphaerochaeta sp. TaxID=886478 RepID=UPI002A0A9D03|nr:MFS transporter [uncultured Sphaerochaeta sp.]